MAKKDKETALTPEEMLEIYVEQIGYEPLIKRFVGDLDPTQSLNDFVKGLKATPIKSVVMDMTLQDLFGVKAKSRPVSEIKELLLEHLGADGESVGDIASALGEDAKQVGKALKALINDGKVVKEGEKRQTVYRLATDEELDDFNSAAEGDDSDDETEEVETVEE